MADNSAVIAQLMRRLQNNPAYQSATGNQQQSGQHPRRVQPGFVSPSNRVPTNTPAQTPLAPMIRPPGTPGIINKQLYDKWMPGGQSQADLRRQYAIDTAAQNKFGLQTRHRDAIGGNPPNPIQGEGMGLSQMNQRYRGAPWAGQNPMGGTGGEGFNYGQQTMNFRDPRNPRNS